MNMSEPMSLNVVNYNVSQQWPFGEALIARKPTEKNAMSDNYLPVIALLPLAQQDEVTAMLDFFDDYQQALLTRALQDADCFIKQENDEQCADIFYQLVSHVFDHNDNASLLSQMFSSVS